MTTFWRQHRQRPENLAAPLRVWDIKVQSLTYDNPLLTALPASGTVPIAADNHSAPTTTQHTPDSFQHVGLKITMMSCGEIYLFNPNIIAKLLAHHNLTNCNSVCIPYVAIVYMSNQRPDEKLCYKAAYQSAVSTLRFIADTTDLAISWITEVLGRHLHNSAPRHVGALKPIHRLISSREDHGLTYTARGTLRLSCYTDSD